MAKIEVSAEGTNIRFVVAKNRNNSPWFMDGGRRFSHFLILLLFLMFLFRFSL